MTKMNIIIGTCSLCGDQVHRNDEKSMAVCDGCGATKRLPKTSVIEMEPPEPNGLEHHLLVEKNPKSRLTMAMRNENPVKGPDARKALGMGETRYSAVLAAMGISGARFVFVSKIRKWLIDHPDAAATTKGLRSTLTDLQTGAHAAKSVGRNRW